MARLDPVPAKTRIAQEVGRLTAPWERWMRNLRDVITGLGTLSTQDADDVTVGDLSVTGAFDVAGVSTLSNNLVLDRTGDATWAQIILNADSANQQRVVVTDTGGTNLPAFTYKKSTDILTVGDSGFASIDLADAPLNVVNTVQFDTANSSIQHDGTSFLFSTTDQFRWQTTGGGDYFISSAGKFDGYYPSATPSVTAWSLSTDHTSTNTEVFVVKVDGDVNNYTGVYGTISDARLKENITDAPSQWEDVKQVRFRHYNRIGSDLRQLGVVAQELQAAGMGGLVSEDEHGTLSVKTSVLTMKALVALQEAMRRIEALETQLNGES